jgi:hypothetical protein
MGSLSATEVRVLSRLIERALARPAEEREAWLAALPEPQQVLVPRIRERLAQLEQPVPGAPPPEPEPMFKPAAPRAVEFLGPYKLLQPLGGEEGQAHVWRVERSEGKSRLALVLRLQPEAAEGSAAPRERERQEVVMLPQHPRIVRLADVGVDAAGRRYRVMPFVEGVDLAAYAERRALPAAQRAKLMLQVCELVELAHAEHVALQALKSSSLRVDDEGQVQLLDWGDGRALRADTLAADVQALGQVLQTLRGSGRGRSGMADADLAAVQARAQSADALQRYASVPALSEDLRLVSTHRPVPGIHANAWHRAQLFLRRRRLELVAGALGLLLLAFVTNMGVRYLVQGRAQVQRGQQAQEFLRENQLDAVAVAASTPAAIPDVGQEAPRLQRALEAARLGFAGEPVLRGQVLVELGVRFRALGQPEQALAVLREAVALLRGTASAAEPALHLARAQLALQLLQNQAPGAVAEARALVEPVQSACSGAACEQALVVARQVAALLATPAR